MGQLLHYLITLEFLKSKTYYIDMTLYFNKLHHKYNCNFYLII